MCWADGRSSGAALTPDPPPTDVPDPRESPVTTQWKISNAPEPTCQYAGQLGALERSLLRETRGDYSADESGEEAMRGLSVKACLTDASRLNGAPVAIHKLRG